MYNFYGNIEFFFGTSLNQVGCHLMRLKLGKITSIWGNMQTDGGKGLRVAGR